MLAEQALRRLAGAGKVGVRKLPSGTTGAKKGKGDGGAKGREVRRRRGEGQEDMFADMMREVGVGRSSTGLGGDGGDVDMSFAFDGLREAHYGSRAAGDAVEGVVVNWDMAGWRQGGGAATAVGGRRGASLRV